VIVNEIDFANVAFIEAKNDSPVRAHRNRPEAFQVTLKRVETKRMDVQVLCALGRINRCEYEPDASQVLSRNPAGIVFFVESPQTTVPEAHYHLRIVK
jgi:hypothetical protein